MDPLSSSVILCKGFDINEMEINGLRLNYQEKYKLIYFHLFLSQVNNFVFTFL